MGGMLSHIYIETVVDGRHAHRVCREQREGLLMRNEKRKTEKPDIPFQSFSIRNCCCALGETSIKPVRVSQGSHAAVSRTICVQVPWGSHAAVSKTLCVCVSQGSHAAVSRTLHVRVSLGSLLRSPGLFLCGSLKDPPQFLVLFCFT